MSSSPSSVHTTQTRAEGSSRSWAQRLPVVLRPGPALGYDLMRAYLGIGLFVRGVLFVSEPELLLGYMQDVHTWFLPYALVHFVAVAHLCGGLMLAAGLLTRLAAATQVPILFGAVFLLCSAWALISNEHIRIDIVNNMLPKRVRDGIDVFGHLFFLLPVTIVIAWLGWPFFWRSLMQNEQSTNAGGLPVYPSKFLIPLASQRSCTIFPGWSSTGFSLAWRQWR